MRRMIGGKGPPYHPRMMTKILLYVGIAWECFRRARSRSDWWKTLPFACWRPVINQISGPSRIFGSCIPKGAGRDAFQQMLRLTLETGTMKLGRVALDGSKVKANASKHKAMSYGRMEGDGERSGCGRKCGKLLSQAAAADKEEGPALRSGSAGRRIAGEELQRRETRIARIREAQRALEERAREQLQGARGKDAKKAQPAQKAQYRLYRSGVPAF